MLITEFLNYVVGNWRPLCAMRIESWQSDRVQRLESPPPRDQCCAVCSGIYFGTWQGRPDPPTEPVRFERFG